MHCQTLLIITVITSIACKDVKKKMNTNYSNAIMHVHVYVHVIYMNNLYTPFFTCISKSKYKHAIHAVYVKL